MEFIDKMTALYGPPFQLKAPDSVRLALVEYTEALLRFTDQERAEGWRVLCAEHDAKTWPSVAACVKACLTAKHGNRPVREVPKRDNMRRRNEYTERRVPELVAQWQWDHADVWKRARAEDWHWELLVSLKREAWTVAHREYDKDAEGEYRVQLEPAEEARIKAVRETRRLCGPKWAGFKLGAPVESVA